MGEDDYDTTKFNDCLNFHDLYEECLLDTQGNMRLCDNFKKSLHNCEMRNKVNENNLKRLKLDTTKYVEFTQVKDGNTDRWASIFDRNRDTGEQVI